MKLIDFLRTKTRCYEFCAITLVGWTIFTAWIDDEDLFKIPEKYYDAEVIKEQWGSKKIVDQLGRENKVPCHYIDIELPTKKHTYKGEEKW